MIKIGYHVSSAGGFLAMGRRARKLGANTFAFFTRNPRGGASKPVDEEDVKKFIAYCADEGIETVVAHAPYTLNPAGEKESVREFAHLVLREDLERMEHIPGQLYNFHPGSHVGQGVDEGIRLIQSALNETLFPGMRTTVLLETMAGKGSEIGGSFEELRRIMDGVKLGENIGVCLDTCHIFDGGYDIENDLAGVLERFDRVIGLGKLKAIHLNNSMYGLSSHKDRHAKLLEGRLSREAIERIIKEPAFRGLPFILETPNEDEGYEAEIRAVREMAGE